MIKLLTQTISDTCSALSDTAKKNCSADQLVTVDLRADACRTMMASSHCHGVVAMHLVFECHVLADLREQFASIFKERQTMQHFMWQPDTLQVANFLDAGVKRRQDIDPDAGSNNYT